MRESSAFEKSYCPAKQKQEENSISAPFEHTVILGLGDPLHGDKGIGAYAARRLQAEKMPETAKVVQARTAILDTVLALKYAKRLIVLDAMIEGGTPGSVYKISLDQCDGCPCLASMHDFDMLKVMALAGRKRKDPLPIVVFGMEPEKIDRPITLSPAVSSALSFLIDAVQEELRN